MRAQNVMLSEASRQGMSLTSKLCPCCRHPFTLQGLIEIAIETTVPSSHCGGAEGDTEGASSGGDEAGGSSSGSGKQARGKQARGPGGGGGEGAGPSGAAGPSYSGASTLEDAHAMPAPPGEPVRNLRYPSIASSLLAHLAAATGLGWAGRLGRRLG